MGLRCADHVTPLYPQKLALTSPTGGGRSVGIVRSRTKATEFFTVPQHNYHQAYRHIISFLAFIPVAFQYIIHMIILTLDARLS